MKILSIFVSLVTLLQGCSQLGKEHIVGKYYITYADYSEKNRDVSYKLDVSGDYIGVVGPMVTAVGFNDKFIIVRQSPDSEAGKAIGEQYYIIPVDEQVSKSPDENKLGPFSFEEFEDQRAKLGVPENVEFTLLWRGI